MSALRVLQVPDTGSWNDDDRLLGRLRPCKRTGAFARGFVRHASDQRLLIALTSVVFTRAIAISISWRTPRAPRLTRSASARSFATLPRSATRP